MDQQLPTGDKSSSPEPPPIDEDALVEERRRKRQEIRAKHLLNPQSHVPPLLIQALQPKTRKLDLSSQSPLKALLIAQVGTTIFRCFLVLTMHTQVLQMSHHQPLLFTTLPQRRPPPSTRRRISQTIIDVKPDTTTTNGDEPSAAEYNFAGWISLTPSNRSGRSPAASLQTGFSKEG